MYYLPDESADHHIRGLLLELPYEILSFDTSGNAEGFFQNSGQKKRYGLAYMVMCDSQMVRCSILL